MKALIKLFVFTLFCVVLAGTNTKAQMLISAEPGDPHSSAALEIRSESGGLLIPTIVMEKTNGEALAPSIIDPADGLLIFHNGYASDGVTPSGLPKGLWYFDATSGDNGKWLIYSRIGSIFSSSLMNFGEMYEINDMGSGTELTINDQFSVPWSSATEGFLGPGFSIDYNAEVQTEIGTTAIADQLTTSTDSAYFTVDVSTTLTTGTSGNIVSGQLFVNDIPKPSIFFRHAFQASGEYVNCATSGLIILGPMDKVDFRFKTSSGAWETIYIEHLNLKLTMLGPKP